MAELFVCPKGSIDLRSIDDLREAGVVVVEADDPDSCRFIRANEVVSTDDLLWAALSALQVKGEYSDKGAVQREAFAARVWAIVNQQREANKARLAAAVQSAPLLAAGDGQ